MVLLSFNFIIVYQPSKINLVNTLLRLFKNLRKLTSYSFGLILVLNHY